MVIEGFGLDEKKSKGVFGIRGERWLSKALDWTRESQKDCFGLEEKEDDDSRMVESFEEKSSDLCHNAPAVRHRSGYILCQMTQIEVTMGQIGGELCFVQYSSCLGKSRQFLHTGCK